MVPRAASTTPSGTASVGRADDGGKLRDRQTVDVGGGDEAIRSYRQDAYATLLQPREQRSCGVDARIGSGCVRVGRTHCHVAGAQLIPTILLGRAQHGGGINASSKQHEAIAEKVVEQHSPAV